MRDGVAGHVEPGFEAVSDMFGRLFAARGRGGGSLVVRRGDRILVDIWGGFADPRSGRRWARESVGLSFSTTKGIASTVIHRLADRGLLSYEEPVATYWPQFAAGGKATITVRQLMTHQAGLDRLSLAAPNGVAALDHVGAEERLAAAAPAHAPGTPAYHAVTYGWLLAGLARAITGRGMRELVQTEIAEPLGIDGLNIGRPTAPGGEPVPAFVGSLGPLVALGPVAMTLLPSLLPGRRALESGYVPGMDRLFGGSNPALLDTEMPAVNGLFTAGALATVYGALANGGMIDGRRLLSAETVNTIGRVQTRAVDRNLMIPMRWRLGYHQAFVPGIEMPRAFGHYGLSGSGGWADPASGLSLGFVSNRIYPITAPFGDLALIRLSRAAVHAARRHRVTAERSRARPFDDQRLAS